MNLHQALKQIKESHDSTGICCNLGEVFSAGDTETLFAMQRKVRELAKGWPEYSGDEVYPVPCEGMPSRSAYLTLPKWEGEYGAARMRLLNYLIEMTSEP